MNCIEDNMQCEGEAVIVVFVRRAPDSLEFLPTDFRMCFEHGKNGGNTITRNLYDRLVAEREQESSFASRRVRLVFECESTIPDKRYFHVGYEGDTDPIGGVVCTDNMAQWLRERLNRGV